jgi:hypothetical protein
MKGYKASHNQVCRGFYFEVGQTYSMEEKPVLCQQGFHFCSSVDSVLNYYDIFDKRFLLFEVNAIGDIETEGDKSCTNKIEIVRIMPKSEFNSFFKRNKFEFNEKGQLIYFQYANGDEYRCDNAGNCILRQIEGRVYEAAYNEKGSIIWEKFTTGMEVKYDGFTGLSIWKKLSNGDEYEFKNGKWAKIEKE